jgi:hypothetical protein
VSRSVQRARAVLAVAGWAGVLACSVGAGEPKHPPAGSSSFSYTAAEELRASTYDVMPQSSMVPLRVDHVGQISLGRSADETPTAVASVKLTDSAIVVLDPASRRVRFYTRSGVPIASIAFDSAGVVRHSSPVQVQSHGDTVFVVDIDPRRGIVAYDTKGRGLLKLAVPFGGITGVAALTGHRLVSVMARDEDVKARQAAVLWRLGTAGADSAPQRLGCVPDSLLRSSLEKRTAYELFRFVGVSADERRLFCRQALSPVVQILRADGTPDGMLHRAPPFYRRGPAPSEKELEDAAMEQFRATWTEHAAFFVMRAGFVSLYGTYDPSVRLERHLLFACDSATGPTRCGVGELRGNLHDLRAPDTLIVAEPVDSAQGVQRLGLYVLRFP